MRTAAIGGTYLRIAEADWDDALDASFAQAAGGRWNAPASHNTLYLNADEVTARANLRANFAGLPYGPEDLNPAHAPHLVEVAVPTGEACELRTADGLAEVALPTTYPANADGDLVPWKDCQPIGARALAAGLDGIACRSTAEGGREELAFFPQAHRPPATQRNRHEFADWYWTVPDRPG